MDTYRHLTSAQMLAMWYSYAQVFNKSSWITDVQGHVGPQIPGVRPGFGRLGSGERSSLAHIEGLDQACIRQGLSLG